MYYFYILINLFLLLCVCQAAKKYPLKEGDEQAGSDPQTEFKDFLKKRCFNATKGVAMAGLSKYLMTASKDAYECLNLCISYGLSARPPVCCHAVNYFANKHADPDIPDDMMFLKAGSCECYYSPSYVAESKKKLAIWLKRESNNKCLHEDENCPAMPTMPPPPMLFGRKRTTKPTYETKAPTENAVTEPSSKR